MKSHGFPFKRVQQLLDRMGSSRLCLVVYKYVYSNRIICEFGDLQKSLFVKKFRTHRFNIKCLALYIVNLMTCE
jgi:hypothetical protein